MKHQRRLTGLRAIWNPCRSPAKSNMDALSFRDCAQLCAPRKQQTPREGGHEQPLEDDIHHEARGNAR